MCAWLYYKETGKWYSKGQIIMIFKDWNKTNLLTKKDYPKFPVATVDFDLGTPEEVEEWIVKRFKRIEYLEKLSDLDLPLCNMEERFNTGNKYAVKKKVWKKAFRVFDSLDEARELLIELEQKYPGEYEIEERIGEDKKCKDYCSCCQFCPYYLEHYDLEHKEIMEELQNV